MAATFDPILGKLRTNDFGDKERAEVRKLIEDMAGDTTKEVVSAASLSALEALEEKSTEVVYIAKDTSKIYLWDGTAFQDKTGSLVDDVIYVSDMDDLLDVQLDSNKSYNVLRYTSDTSGEGATHDVDWGGYVNPPDEFGNTSIRIVCSNLGHEYNSDWFLSQKNAARTTGVPIHLEGLSDSDYRTLLACRYIFENHVEHQPNEGLDHYVLTISSSGKRYLDGKKGWAIADGGEWAWNNYSYQGQPLEIQEVNGLGERLQSIESGLQGKQATLVSGTNIKTVNNQSILGEGNINIQQNVIVGTQAQRLAFTPWEGLEWHETHTDPSTGEVHIIRYLYENGAWRIIESPETETDETVVLHVSTYDGLGDVEGLAVGVTDNTTHDSETYNLNSSGQCTFTIRKGHTYTITVATLTGYHDLPDETFEAVRDERSINMIFQATATNYGRVVVHITAYNASMQNSSSLQDEFIGVTVTCNITGESEPMTALIGSDHTAVFNIPYGKQYTIRVPYVAGFIAIYQQEWSHTASIPERTLPAHYLVWNGSDISVLDCSNGSLLSYDAVNAMSQAEKETLASHCALYVNTSALQAANASFCYKLPLSTASRAWANSNVQFDTDLLPYKQSHSAAVVCLNGPTNTQNIRAIGDSLGVETPAADWCAAQQLTVDGVTYNGYLGEYGEMKQLVDNLSQLTAFHLLLGFPAPTFNSGPWWTSTQYSDTYAVILGGGGFRGNYRTDGLTCVALFRPFGN